MIIQRNFTKKLILYGLIGGTSALCDFLVFCGLVNLLHLHGLISNIISVHCGIILSFVLNRNFNFKKMDHALKRFLLFYCIGLFGLGLSSLILVIGNQMSLSIIFVKIFSIFFVAGIQFLLNNYITFRSTSVNMKEEYHHE